MPFIIGGAIAGGGSIISGLIGAGAAKSAASQQAAAQLKAAELEQKRFEETRGALAPYVGTGTAVLPALANMAWDPYGGTGATNYLALAQGEMPTVPGRMTESQLVETPGYQFTL